MTNRQTILLVDDDPGFTSVLRLHLEETGRFDVVEVNDPAAAVEAVRRVHPDLVVLDVIMPELDGPDLAEEFASDPATRRLPTIFVTSLVDPGEVPAEGLINGRRRLISKGCQSAQLIQCIDDLLKQSPSP